MKLLGGRELLASYRTHFPYCEMCAKLECAYPVDNPEIHHIFGGHKRVHELWNIICLCHEHHRHCTYHDLDYGTEAAKWNSKALAIKLLKNEINEEQLDKLASNWKQHCIQAASEILDSANYVFGLRRRWYTS